MYFYFQNYINSLTQGDTALHFAIRMRDRQAVRFLIDANANVHIVNKNNKSPLDLVEDDSNLKTFFSEIISQKKVNFNFYHKISLNSLKFPHNSFKIWK